MPPLVAAMLLDDNICAIADFTFLNFDIGSFAYSISAARPVVGRDLCPRVSGYEQQNINQEQNLPKRYGILCRSVAHASEGADFQTLVSAIDANFKSGV